MKNVVVVGSQWGDEGKGKIVDWLSSEADVVIRFQGGHNAGHTLVIDGKTYKLRLLPSGIVRKNKISIIGNGVVVDPWALLEEIEDLHQRDLFATLPSTIQDSSLVLLDRAALLLATVGFLVLRVFLGASGTATDGSVMSAIGSFSTSFNLFVFLQMNNLNNLH